MNIVPLLLVLAQQQPVASLDPYTTQAMKDWRVLDAARGRTGSKKH